MSTQQQRQEWRELAAAATPGEWVPTWNWEHTESYEIPISAWGEGPTRYGSELSQCAPQAEADAAFIAAARSAVPQLLADGDALTQERDALAASWQEEHTERVRLEERLKAAEQRAEALQGELESERETAREMAAGKDW